MPRAALILASDVEGLRRVLKTTVRERCRVEEGPRMGAPRISVTAMDLMDHSWAARWDRAGVAAAPLGPGRAFDVDEPID